MLIPPLNLVNSQWEGDWMLIDSHTIEYTYLQAYIIAYKNKEKLCHNSTSIPQNFYYNMLILHVANVIHFQCMSSAVLDHH